MPTRNVVLTDQQVTMIEKLVRSGRYQNASEVLRDGLRLIESRDARESVEVEARRAKLLVAEDATALEENASLETLILEVRAARERMAPVTLDEILTWRDAGRA